MSRQNHNNVHMHLRVLETLDGFSAIISSTGLHTNVGYDNIPSKFDFQGPGLKVKVTGYLQTNFVIALVPTFIDGF